MEVDGYVSYTFEERAGVAWKLQDFTRFFVRNMSRKEI